MRVPCVQWPTGKLVLSVIVNQQMYDMTGASCEIYYQKITELSEDRYISSRPFMFCGIASN